MVAGQFALMTSSAISEALRVATAGFSALIFFFSSTRAVSTAAGTSPACRESNIAPRAESVPCLRLAQSSRARLPRAPMARHSAAMSVGMTNGS